MPTFENSLHCLKHPITLLCIGLLLVNDHVLKVVVPSWLTGKLSDFAGLFFFPFLLAIGLSLILRRASLQTIGAFAFGITAIWFALIKTTVWGNALTAEFVSRLLGVPVQIILDPTDLIALGVLLPAWQLWNRVQVARPTRLSWIVLGIASLATVATSPCPPTARIDRIFYADGILYAHYSTLSSRSLTTWWSDEYYLFSKNDGRSWSYICDYKTQKCQDVPTAVKSPAQLPVVECSQEKPGMCYRIIAPEQVEGSNDGGQTWQIVWRIPAGRRYYMQRVGEYGRCWRAVDPGPYDLILPKTGEYTVIVAMGTEGLLVRNHEGNWQQVGGFWMQDPLKFYAQNFDEAVRVVEREIDLATLVVLFVLLALAFRSARILQGILPQKRPSALRRALPLLIIFVLACLVFGVWYVIGFSIIGSLVVIMISTLFQSMAVSYLALIPIVGLIILSIAFLAVWSPIARSVAFPKRVWQIAGLTVVTALAITLLIVGSFILWAFGVIAEYAIAAFLAALASTLLFGYSDRIIGVIITREQKTYEPMDISH